MTARLHVLLGQGGVGKTTLAAAYALALSRRGRRTGLLGVDPAGRLRSALGLADLPEMPVEIQPGLRAALLRPDDSLRRWTLEELGADGEPLLRNPFFVALTDRLGAATDALAAVRIAEWAEKDPALEDLVVDTAPGLHGLEFLARPERLLAFLNGNLIRWLARAVRPGPTGRRLLRGMSRLAGGTVLAQLSDFSLFIQQIASTLIARLEFARTWLRARDTELLLICVPRPAAATGVSMLADQLEQLGFHPAGVVLNRALPKGLLAKAPPADTQESRAFLRYVSATMRIQAEVLREMETRFCVAQVPVGAGLDAAASARVAALESLGGSLIAALELSAHDLRRDRGPGGVALA